ncbi:N-acetyltransferase [Lysobacter sp. Root559]|uniref:N-acetyltransferase n=1 Tax=Lysobacter sp. Root559 TaxID=1736559 RepID=UPI0012FB0FCD|nr:N-acetyltransferase [Lysobacter sp. Root559]
MPKMTDPTAALTSFQRAVHARSISIERGRLDPNVYVHFDQPQGEARFTYVRLDGGAVTALANFMLNGSVDGAMCWAVGYAVPEGLRGQGRARDIVQSGIAELQNGFKDHPRFFVEAVIDIENIASQRVAAAVLGGEPEAIIDGHSKRPAVRYTAEFRTAR